MLLLAIYPVNILLCGYNLTEMVSTPEVGQKIIPVVCNFAGFLPGVALWALLNPAFGLSSPPWPTIAIVFHITMSLYGRSWNLRMALKDPTENLGKFEDAVF